MLLVVCSPVLLETFVEAFKDVFKQGPVEAKWASCQYLETIQDLACRRVEWSD